ncbi:MAG TPA: UvrD-helicase domain-containing protein [Chthoniobacterales bacterium]
MSSFRFFDLNPEQHRAATHPGGPMLILAGAGTGKTRVITARVTWLIANGIPADKILAVTFTNKAARELKERIAGMVEPEKAKLVTASTFHSLCLKILRRDIERLGYKPNFTIYDEGDQTGLIKKIINRTAAKDESLDPNAAKAGISKAKNMGWSPPEDDKTLLGAVYARYQRELKLVNAIDFDDMLTLSVRLLADFPAVRDHWREKYDHLLVDEFQDTNKLQLDLVTLLCRERRPNICVVGDDDQSIYGWRGAEISNILEFERHFPNPEIFKLEQNYRSTNAILGAANRLIKNNARRRGKKLWSDSKEGANVTVISADHDKTEAEFVVNEINAHKHSERQEWEHFAVLYRMNAQSRLIEGELRRMKIPYRLVGGRSFFDRREVKDVISYLNFLANPRDDASLLRILTAPPRGIGGVTIESAIEFSAKANANLLDSMTSSAFGETLSNRARNAVQTFADEMQAARIRLMTPGANAAELIGSILADCGYLEDLKRSCKTPEEALSRETNVRELLDALAEYQTKHKDWQGFLDDIQLDRDREKDKEDGRGVTLITLHAAKGLEFPHVFLIGAEEGLLPHERSKLEGTVDEERRLFYVGITRARKTLTISHCLYRTKFGSRITCKSSSFLKEIEGENVDFVSHAEVMARPVKEEEALDLFARAREMINES